LKLAGFNEWIRFCKGEIMRKGSLPKDIPRWPNESYEGKGWKGFGDWVGTDRIANMYMSYKPFKRARAHARAMKLKSQLDWAAYCKGQLKGYKPKPADIPAGPARVYAKYWRGWGDWLGTGREANQKRTFLPFKRARALVRKLRLKSSAEWRAVLSGARVDGATLRSDIPAAPDRVYADKGWDGMGDWLGTGNVRSGSLRYRSFVKARKFSRSLKLETAADWKRFCAGRILKDVRLPADIPKIPSHIYARKGWKGFADWLGTDRKTKGKRRRCVARKIARSPENKKPSPWKTMGRVDSGNVLLSRNL
jgi:hypothetical protein